MLCDAIYLSSSTGKQSTVLEIRIVVTFWGVELMSGKVLGESTGTDYNVCHVLKTHLLSPYDLSTFSSVCFTLIVYLKKKIDQ